MKVNRIFNYFIVLFTLCLNLLCLGQSNIEKHRIRSIAVNSDYLIEIVLPKEYSKEEKYPIVYCTDWFHTSGFLKSIYSWLEYGRSVKNVILVGISVEKNAQEWSVNRYRDFTPTHPHDNYSIGYTYAPALELTGGANNFVKFIKHELIPFAESKFSSDTSKRGFIGYSLGGLLCAYILYHDPGIFHYYLIGSPSLWWDNFSLINELKDSKTEPIRQGKIYLSIGEYEDGEMLQGFGQLRDYIEKTVQIH
ncbi:MAG: hypothetical protein KKG99_02160 [Bacteroidetes bacterium]|nr:hypothetical protein [Bacteroidota bacterium]